MTRRETTCLICGANGNDVRVGLVSWRNPVDGQRYSAIPRCIDRLACRSRVEANGDEWEVQDPERSAKELIR